MSGTQLRWGILGAGSIAKTFAKDLPDSRSGRLVAVGSRDKAKAQAFLAEVGVTDATAHGSYEALLADSAVDVVYIATPHPQHAEWAIKAAKAGKHLLVEKPLAVSATEADAIVDAAEQAGVFLLEAFMYRCHPQTAKIVELVRSGIIGEVRLIQASFGFHGGKNPDSRLFNAELAGGAIMDVGCYAASFARLIAGAANGKDFCDPIDVKGHGTIGDTGVDEWAAATMTFPGNIVAEVSTAVSCNLENAARIFGSKGRIEILQPWGPSRFGASKIVVRVNAKDAEELSISDERGLYAIEADTVAECLSAGQAPAMPWADTLGQAKTLDRWRNAIGLKYPPEQEKPDRFPAGVLGRAPKLGTSIPRMNLTGCAKPVSRLAMGLSGDPNHAAVLFDAFWEAGGNCFDTSWHYGSGHCDRILGRWIRSRGVRKEAVIIAKGAHTPWCTPEHVTKQLMQSLEYLQTDFADTYFMHRDNLEVPIDEFVDVLNEHHRAGRIGLFGGSNWSLERVQAFNECAKRKGLEPMRAVSNNFSLARMVNPVWAGCIASSEPTFAKWHGETQTAVLSWSSQARGFFVRGDRAFTADGEMTNSWYSDDNFERKARAEVIAKEQGVTANNVALAYVLQQAFPTIALVGPANLKELRTTLPGLHVKLSENDRRWLNLEVDQRERSARA